MASRAVCHPDKKLHARGMCHACYFLDVYSRKPEVVERRLKRAKDDIANGKAAERNWRWRIKRRFGVTEDRYHEMLKEQDGRCAICKRLYDDIPNARKKKFAVDHDHDTEEVRGLLCDACNRALGLFRDSVDMLQSAIDYLKTARK